MDDINKSKTGSSPNLKVEVKKSSGVTEAIQEKAAPVIEEGKAQVRAYTVEAQQKTKSAVANKKEQAVGELGNLAQALRQTGIQLRQQDQNTVAQYTEKAAQQIDRVSGYLSKRDVDQLIEEGERLARKNPELFLGVTFGLGLLAARFIKSSPQRKASENSNIYDEKREAMSGPMAT